MQTSVLFYLAAIVVMHFGVVLAMVFLTTAGYSIKTFLAKEPESRLSGAIISDQIRYLLPIVAISTLISSLALLLPKESGQLINAVAVVFDIGGPLIVMVRTLKKISR
jgi:hypothetical protein